MTFLPIVERELRVASRKRMTYWMRNVAVGIATVFFGCVLPTAIRGGRFMGAGTIEFSVMKWLAFVYAAAAGMFLTSDTLSEEKREGTLGLLFLTDLRGYDVVIGKLISESLQGFYSLLAAFPILALPLLMGGVSGMDFGRSLLVICNMLFISLAAGMFAGAISREVVKAMSLTFCLNFLFAAGLPWLDWVLAQQRTTPFKPITSIASPGHLLAVEGSLWPRQFWFQFALQHLLGWILLGLASFCAPRAWQEKPMTGRGLRQLFFRWWWFGGQRRRLVRRKKLLTKNPALWLALRDKGMARIVWLAFVVIEGMIAWRLFNRWFNPNYINFGDWQALLIFMVILWVGLQACQLFLESRRNGAMELMLVTPLTPKEIIAGQWKAILRIFLLPVLVLVGLQIAEQIQSIMEMKETMRHAKQPLPWPVAEQYVQLANSVLTLAGDLAAMAWFGMWMGLTSRKIPLALLKTVLLVCILPLIAEVIIIDMFGMSWLMRMKLPLWLGSVTMTGTELVKNLFFIWFSRRKLLTRFREVAAHGGSTFKWRRRRSLRLAPAQPKIAAAS